MRTLILSDLHLGSRHCNGELLEGVLGKETFDRLILNGDTLHNVNFRKFTAQHWMLLDKLRKLGRSRELILIRGNHDHEWDHRPTFNRGSLHESPPGRNGASHDDDTPLGTGCLLPGLLDVPMLEDYRLSVHGRDYMVLHGDRFDPTMNFQMLTEVAFLAYQFTSKVNRKLAKWLKKKSKRWGGILAFVRRQSVIFAREAGFAGIITGHTHFAEDLHVDDVHYVNTGSWTENPCAYVTVDSRGITLHHVSECTA